MHFYSYDLLNRPGMDSVTTVGTNVDDSVRLIFRKYNTNGRLKSITSYSDTNATDDVNGIAFTYNGLGQITESDQDHESVAGGGSADVNYVYDDTVAGGLFTYASRLKQVTYPSGRNVYYHYTDETDAGDWTLSEKIDNTLSRVRTIASTTLGATNILDSAVFARFTYLGAGRIVQELHPAVTNGLTLDYGSSGTYGGLDNLGRVKDQKWAGTAVKDRHRYGYDLASNRTWRRNGLADEDNDARSEFYTYDGLHRLTNVKRGQLTGTPPTQAPSTVAVERLYGLDGVGNWKTYEEKASGSTTLKQQREHNKANEIDDSDAETGGDQDNPANPIESTESTPDWIDPKYDANGNMISGPKPAAESTVEHHYLYDAWNRLKVVYIDGNSDDEWDGGTNDTLVAKYEYDGLHRRIVKIVPNPAAPTTKRDRTDYYYNTSWQVLEERWADDVTPANETTEATDPKYQYVWSLRYIDAPVLRDENTDPASDEDCDDERLYYCTDANMNVTALIETDGDVAERYVYDPYGKATIYDSGWIATVGWTSSKENEILYCGYRYDHESALHHVRNRWYHPTLGRWITRDPKGYVDGMSLYEYVGSGPVVGVDPMGLYEQWQEGAVEWDAVMVPSGPEQPGTIIPVPKTFVEWGPELADGHHGQFLFGWSQKRCEACTDPQKIAITAALWRSLQNIHKARAAMEAVAAFDTEGREQGYSPRYNQAVAAMRAWRLSSTGSRLLRARTRLRDQLAKFEKGMYSSTTTFACDNGPEFVYPSCQGTGYAEEFPDERLVVFCGGEEPDDASYFDMNYHARVWGMTHELSHLFADAHDTYPYPGGNDVRVGGNLLPDGRWTVIMNEGRQGRSPGYLEFNPASGRYRRRANGIAGWGYWQYSQHADTLAGFIMEFH